MSLDRDAVRAVAFALLLVLSLPVGTMQGGALKGDVSLGVGELLEDVEPASGPEGVSEARGMRASAPLAIDTTPKSSTDAEATLRGTVTDHEGDPIEGATVEASETTTGADFSTTTASDGTWELGVDAGTYSVVAQVEAVTSSEKTADVSIGDTREVDLSARLPDPEAGPTELDGTVYELDGPAIENASITVFEYDSDTEVASASTNATGEWSVELAPGSYTVNATKDGTSDTVDIAVYAGEDNAVEQYLDLPEETRLRLNGTVTNASSGNPIEGATVAVVGPETAGATTDEDGNWNAGSLTPGEYTVTADADGYEPQSIGVSLEESKSVELALVPKDDSSGNATLDVTVQNPDGKPIEGATVTGDGPTGFLEFTDSSGSATASDLDSGQYSVSAKKNGYKKTETSVSLSEDETDEVTLTLERKTGTLEVTVQDSEGDPIEDATVTGEGPASFEETGKEPESFEETTDSSGTVTVSDLYVGEYTLSATADKYEKSAEQSVYVSGSDTTETVVTLERATGSLNVTVLDGQDETLEGALVTVEGPTEFEEMSEKDPLELERVTNADGNVSFEDLKVGDYEVTARYTDLGEASEEVTITADEQSNLEISLGYNLTVETAADTEDGSVGGIGGTVELSPPGTSGSSLTETYGEGSEVQVKASPDEGSEFTKWTGDLPGGADAESETIIVTMDSDRTLTAVFEATKPQLTVKTNGSGTVTAEPPRKSGEEFTAEYQKGEATEVELTAEAEENWRFEGWTGDVAGVPTSETITVTMDRARTVTAEFSDQGDPCQCLSMLEGTVLDTNTGEPVERAVIRVEGATESGTLTNKEGEWDLAVPPGEYTVTAAANGVSTEKDASVDIAETKTVDMELAATALTGEAVFADGEPVPKGAELSVTLEGDGETTEAEINLDSTWRAAVPYGTYTITAKLDLPDGGTQTREVTFEYSEENDHVRLVFEREDSGLSFSYNPTDPVADESIRFVLDAPWDVPNSEQATWDFDTTGEADRTFPTKTGEMVSHSFPRAGTYTVDVSLGDKTHSKEVEVSGGLTVRDYELDYEGTVVDGWDDFTQIMRVKVHSRSKVTSVDLQYPDESSLDTAFVRKEDETTYVYDATVDFSQESLTHTADFLVVTAENKGGQTTETSAELDIRYPPEWHDGWRNLADTINWITFVPTVENTETRRHGSRITVKRGLMGWKLTSKRIPGISTIKKVLSKAGLITENQEARLFEWKTDGRMEMTYDEASDSITDHGFNFWLRLVVLAVTAQGSIGGPIDIAPTSENYMGFYGAKMQGNVLGGGYIKGKTVRIPAKKPWFEFSPKLELVVGPNMQFAWGSQSKPGEVEGRIGMTVNTGSANTEVRLAGPVTRDIANLFIESSLRLDGDFKPTFDAETMFESGRLRVDPDFRFEVALTRLPKFVWTAGQNKQWIIGADEFRGGFSQLAGVALGGDDFTLEDAEVETRSVTGPKPYESVPGVDTDPETARAKATAALGGTGQHARLTDRRHDDLHPSVETVGDQTVLVWNAGSTDEDAPGYDLAVRTHEGEDVATNWSSRTALTADDAHDYDPTLAADTADESLLTAWTRVDSVGNIESADDLSTFFEGFDVAVATADADAPETWSEPLVLSENTTGTMEYGPTVEPVGERRWVVVWASNADAALGGSNQTLEYALVEAIDGSPSVIDRGTIETADVPDAPRLAATDGADAMLAHVASETVASETTKAVVTREISVSDGMVTVTKSDRVETAGVTDLAAADGHVVWSAPGDEWTKLMHFDGTGTEQIEQVERIRTPSELTLKSRPGSEDLVLGYQAPVDRTNGSRALVYRYYHDGTWQPDRRLGQVNGTHRPLASDMTVTADGFTQITPIQPRNTTKSAMGDIFATSHQFAPEYDLNVTLRDGAGTVIDPANATLAVGDSVTLEYTIRNVGDVDASEAVPVSVSTDENQTPTVREIGPLSVGEATTGELSLSVPSPGTIGVAIDPADESETIYADPAEAEPWTPRNETFRLAASGLAPVTVETSPHNRTHMNATVTVDNEGTVTAENVTLGLVSKETLLAEATLDAVRAGEEQTITVPIEKAAVDPDGPDRLVIDPAGELAPSMIAQQSQSVSLLETDYDVLEPTFYGDAEDSESVSAVVGVWNEGPTSPEVVVRVSKLDETADSTHSQPVETLTTTTAEIRPATDAGPAVTRVPVQFNRTVEAGTPVAVSVLSPHANEGLGRTQRRTSIDTVETGLGRVRVTVTDGGVPVQEATVRSGGKLTDTDTSGKATLQRRTGSRTVEVSAEGESITETVIVGHRSRTDLSVDLASGQTDAEEPGTEPPETEPPETGPSEADSPESGEDTDDDEADPPSVEIIEDPDQIREAVDLPSDVAPQRAEKHTLGSAEEDVSGALFSKDSPVVEVRFEQAANGEATVTTLASDDVDDSEAGLSGETEAETSDDTETMEAPGETITAADIAVPDEAEDMPATIAFRVSRERLAGDVSAEQLRVYRHSDGGQFLPTEVIRKTDDTVILEAETPAFSVFSVRAVGQPTPVIDASVATPKRGTESLRTLQLDASNSSVTHGELVDYQWAIGDEWTDGRAVTRQVEPGLYTVTLVVKTDAGVREAITETITVEETSQATPTAATPVQPAPTATPNNGVDATTSEDATGTATAPIRKDTSTVTTSRAGPADSDETAFAAGIGGTSTVLLVLAGLVIAVLVVVGRRRKY